MASDISRIATWLQPQDILLDVDVRDRPHAFEVVAAAIGSLHGLDPAPILRARGGVNSPVRPHSASDSPSRTPASAASRAP